jgi:D-hexose-6-phosphate mutarotase
LEAFRDHQINRRRGSDLYIGLGSSLTTALKAVNPKDSDVEIRLKTFYHNYIAVSDAQMISVTGLKSGLQYKDTLKGGEIGSWDGSELKMNARIGK